MEAAQLWACGRAARVARRVGWAAGEGMMGDHLAAARTCAATLRQ